MKSKIFLLRIFLLMAVLNIAFAATAQSGNLSIVNENGTYKVTFTPTSSGAFTLGASSLVALKAPLGTMALPTTVTDVSGGPWTLTSPKQSDANFDYWGYTTSGNTALTLTSGTPITLFTFPAPLPCNGTVSIVDPANLPAGGSGIVNGFDFGTTINSPVSGNIASVTGAGAVCANPLTAQTPPVQTQTAGAPATGNAATELAPSGGVGSYTYLQDISSSCIAPSGATALPTPVTVNSSTGAYSYNTPSNPGTYYYCIKVCDAGTPQSCVTKTYTISVPSVCNAGSVAPSVH
jgi:hypothetical protein